MRTISCIVVAVITALSSVLAQTEPTTGQYFMYQWDGSLWQKKLVTPNSSDILTWNGSGLFANLPRSTFAAASHTQAWSTITSTPTTLSGYGITDAITSAAVAAGYQPLSGNLTNLAGVTNTSYGRGLLTTTSATALLSSIIPTGWTWASNELSDVNDSAGIYANTITATTFGGGDGAAITGLSASNISTGSLALGRIAQGGATTGQSMVWNGAAWAPATISGGVTIGSTAITGGTSGRLLTSGTNVGELTLGTGVSAALGNAVNAASGLLTYGIIGTSGAAVPLLNTAVTFSGGVTVTTANLTIGNSGGGSSGRAIYMGDYVSSAGGQAQIVGNRPGSYYWGMGHPSGASATYIKMGGCANTAGTWASDANFGLWIDGGLAVGAMDCLISRDAAAVLAVKNSTTEQTLRVYGTTTGSKYLSLAHNGTNAVITDSATSCILRWGSGTPEGSVTAPVGSLYLRTDGGTSTTLYVKESGSGNTGWIAK